ncbi:MAG: ABC transporter ATP-binding protein [Chloroflexota bacterium]
MSFAALAAFYRASRILTLGSLVLATVSGLLTPSFMVASGAFVEAVRTGSDARTALVALGVIFLLQRVLDPVREQCGQALWPRVDASLTDRMMAAAAAPFGLREIEDPKVLDLIAQARGAFWGFTPGQAAQQFAFIWATRVQAIASLVLVARWSWWPSALLLFGYVGSYLFSRRVYTELSVVVWDQTDRFRRAYYLRGLGLSSEMAKETRIFGLSSWLVDQYRQSSLAVLNDIWRTRHEAWYAALAVVLALLGLEGGVLAWALNDTIAGALTLGGLVTLVQAVITAGQLSRFEEADFGMTQAGASVASVQQLERMTNGPDRIGGGTREVTDLPQRAIRFENVSFGYPHQARRVLDGFDLQITAGQSLAIVGENGAGKTTLIKLLARLYDPTDGRITVDGVDLRDIAPDAWHGRISALFQDFARFHTRAYDNVVFGALHARNDRRAVDRAASEAGVLDLIERLPERWDTVLTRGFTGGADLSGGEWQRLALARALFGVAGGASILVLDEPTAALDVRAEAAIYQHFLDLTRGLTTIVISHRFSTVRRADRIVVVEHGQVVEDGTHDQLMAIPNGHYAMMYELQAARFTAPEAASA